MSATFELIRALVISGDIRISDHGYDEISEENILARDVIKGVLDGVVVEDYPNYAKGPCALILQFDHDRRPLHVVWGIPKNMSSPAVVVTAYRPDPDLWSDDFLRRKP
jgi:hypothetical protein